jgi:hypothetical protein
LTQVDIGSVCVVPIEPRRYTFADLDKFRPCKLGLAIAKDALGEEFSGTLVEILSVDQISYSDRIWAVLRLVDSKDLCVRFAHFCSDNAQIRKAAYAYAAADAAADAAYAYAAVADAADADAAADAADAAVTVAACTAADAADAAVTVAAYTAYVAVADAADAADAVADAVRRKERQAQIDWLKANVS